MIVSVFWCTLGIQGVLTQFSNENSRATPSLNSFSNPSGSGQPTSFTPCGANQGNDNNRPFNSGESGYSSPPCGSGNAQYDYTIWENTAQRTDIPPGDQSLRRMRKSDFEKSGIPKNPPQLPNIPPGSDVSIQQIIEGLISITHITDRTRIQVIIDKVGIDNLKKVKTFEQLEQFTKTTTLTLQDILPIPPYSNNPGQTSNQPHPDKLVPKDDHAQPNKPFYESSQPVPNKPAFEDDELQPKNRAPGQDQLPPNKPSHEDNQVQFNNPVPGNNKPLTNKAFPRDDPSLQSQPFPYNNQYGDESSVSVDKLNIRKVKHDEKMPPPVNVPMDARFGQQPYSGFKPNGEQPMQDLNTEVRFDQEQFNPEQKTRFQLDGEHPVPGYSTTVKTKGEEHIAEWNNDVRAYKGKPMSELYNEVEPYGEEPIPKYPSTQLSKPMQKIPINTIENSHHQLLVQKLTFLTHIHEVDRIEKIIQVIGYTKLESIQSFQELLELIKNTPLTMEDITPLPVSGSIPRP